MSGFDFNTAMKYVAAFATGGALFYLTLIGKVPVETFTGPALALLGGLGVHGVTLASKP